MFPLTIFCGILSMAIAFIGAMIGNERAQFLGIGMLLFATAAQLLFLHDGKKYIFSMWIPALIILISIICVTIALW